MTRALVSVVIPTHNYSQFVVEAVSSAAAQTYPNSEVIVVDDGSTDDTRERLGPYMDRIRYVYQENRGLAAARNTGIRHAQGEWVAFLDSDDLWHAQKTKIQFEAVGNDESICVVGSPNGVEMPAELPAACEMREVSVKDFLCSTPMTGSSIMVRRKCFDEIGLFDESLRSVEDRDMWLRLAARYRVLQVESPCWWYRKHEGQMSRRAQRMLDNYRKVLEKFFREQPEYAALRRIAYAYMHTDAGWCFLEESRRFASLQNLTKSGLYWPCRLGCGKYGQPLFRTKIAVRALLGFPGAGGAMNINTRIRRGEGRFWNLVKRVARAVLSAHIPVAGPLRAFFRGLYALHFAIREALIWALRFFWYEPLFRSQCASVGKRFQMEKLPYVTGSGRMLIGNQVRLSGKPSIGFGNRAYAEPQLVIGDGSFLGHGTTFSIMESVIIGRNCLIAGGVSIRDNDGHPVDAAERRNNARCTIDGISRVVIGDDVWIGACATVLKGVHVGNRAIIGANAVVTTDVPADTVVAGNPGRVIKTLSNATRDGKSNIDMCTADSEVVR